MKRLLLCLLLAGCAPGAWYNKEGLPIEDGSASRNAFSRDAYECQRELAYLRDRQQLMDEMVAGCLVSRGYRWRAR